MDLAFPRVRGGFRFRAESKIVRRLARSVKEHGTVLDLGSGIGFWVEDFATRFSRVIAVESSETLYQALKKRCSPYPNVQTVLGDVMSFEPEGACDLAFLGGMLMYLNEEDVTALLRKLVASLEPGGMILCRESTVRGETLALQGDYQDSDEFALAAKAMQHDFEVKLADQKLKAKLVTTK